MGFRRQYWENISRILGLETILENISRKEKPSEEQHFCKQWHDNKPCFTKDIAKKDPKGKSLNAG